MLLEIDKEIDFKHYVCYNALTAINKENTSQIIKLYSTRLIYSLLK